MTLPNPAPVSVAVVRTDPPDVFLAQDPEVLGRVLALQVVARSRPQELGTHATETIREALLDERWADAVVAWIGATGIAVDAYPDETVWSHHRVAADATAFELRLAPIFEERPRNS